MSKRKTVVGAEAVRAWARDEGRTGAFAGEKARGRLPKALVTEYEAATGHKVETGFRPTATVTLKVTKVDAKGRKRTRSVEKPLAEVRAKALELGVGGKRGVLSTSAVEAVAEALSE